MDASLAILERALSRSETQETIEDIKYGLSTGDYMLWHDPETGTMAVTEPIWPDEMNIYLYAGSLKPLAALEVSCEAWCAAVGIKRMTVTDARSGWSRALRSMGYKSAGGGLLVKEVSYGLKKSDTSV